MDPSLLLHLLVELCCLSRQSCLSGLARVLRCVCVLSLCVVWVCGVGVSFFFFLVRLLFPFPLFSDRMAPKAAIRRAEREDETRRVRARLNEHEGQIDDLQGTARHHDLRLQYLEAPYKWVARGFNSTNTFLGKKDENFRAAKAAFLIEFLQELRECTPGMVEGQVQEFEGLFLESEGAALIGVFPTGGWLGELPDCSIRFVQGFSGLRIGYLLRIIQSVEALIRRGQWPKGSGPAREGERRWQG